MAGSWQLVVILGASSALRLPKSFQVTYSALVVSETRCTILSAPRLSAGFNPVDADQGEHIPEVDLVLVKNELHPGDLGDASLTEFQNMGRVRRHSIRSR